MKVTLKIEIDFDSWFEDDRQPKTIEEWSEFFNTHLMPESSMLGVDGEYQDMIVLNNYKLNILKLKT